MSLLGWTGGDKTAVTRRRRYLHVAGAGAFVVFGVALIAAPGAGIGGRVAGVFTIVVFGAVGALGFWGTRRAALEPLAVSPASASTSGAASSEPSGSVLPIAAVADGTRRAVLVVAAHALALVTALAHPQTAVHREVVAAFAAALVVGAVLVYFAPLAGRLVVVATELILVSLDLTLGHHVAVATRVLYLFFPVCVILVLAQTWPLRGASVSTTRRPSSG